MTFHSGWHAEKFYTYVSRGKNTAAQITPFLFQQADYVRNWAFWGLFRAPEVARNRTSGAATAGTALASAQPATAHVFSSATCVHIV